MFRRLLDLSFRPRTNADLARLASEFGTMIQGGPALRLPLVHHLVQQSLDRGAPSVAPNVAAADRDLGGRLPVCRRIVTQPTLHAPRDAHDDRRERVAKMGGVQAHVLGDEAGSPLGVIGMQPLAAARRRTGGCGCVGDDDLTGLAPPAFGLAIDELDDRIEHFRRRAEIALVDPNFPIPKADHHAGVLRERTAVDMPKAPCSEQSEQLVAGPRIDVKREAKLRRVGRHSPAGDPIPYRLKHFAGPVTKLPTSSDQRSVDTSISAGVIRMLLTDDGRPPRERLEIVPAVEMIVPFLVCSM